MAQRLLLCLGVFLITGCGLLPGEPDPDLPPRPDVSPTPVVPGPVRVVTLADNRSRVTIRSGDLLIAELPPEYDWMYQVDDPLVLLMTQPGQFIAGQRGRTSLQASGEPGCRRSRPPCMLPNLIFRVDVTVD